MAADKVFDADDIIERGSIRDEDVLALRATFYADGSIAPDEAAKLFAINQSAKVQDPAWAEFFIEAMTDYLVCQAEPDGYITDENAKWLIAQISSDGRVEGKTELELLVTVLDRSRWSPVSLIQFALQQVRSAVVDGDGPLRAGPAAAPKGTIADSEVELLRRMIYAFGGDGNIGVTRAEAEVLFDINDAVAGAMDEGDSDINEAWTEFFVKAIANVVMAASSYAPPSREEALRSDAWLEERGELSPAGILRGIVSSGLEGVLGAYRSQSAEERAIARLERQRLEIITNEIIVDGEAEWLAARIERDGQVSSAEEALLAFFREQHSELHPALNDLVERHSEAA